MSKYRNFGPNPIGRPYHPGRYLKKLEATKEEKEEGKDRYRNETKEEKKRKEKESSMKRNKKIVPSHSVEDSLDD